MIPPHLVICSSISRSQINTFKTGVIRRNPEGDANKSTRAFTRAWRWLSGQVHLNDAVLEISIWQNGESTLVTYSRGRRVVKAKRLSTLKGNGFSPYID